MALVNDMGEVRAAGGVVIRETDGGRREVLLVHRPKYDDWTLPKGKAEGDETDEACALREVEEETGFRCRLGAELPTVRWRDHLGRDKASRYWVMTIVAGSFRPHEEVDEIRWVPLDEAGDVLSYSRDADVIRALR